jgi:hypothetical protein
MSVGDARQLPFVHSGPRQMDRWVPGKPLISLNFFRFILYYMHVL